MCNVKQDFARIAPVVSARLPVTRPLSDLLAVDERAVQATEVPDPHVAWVYVQEAVVPRDCRFAFLNWNTETTVLAAAHNTSGAFLAFTDCPRQRQNEKGLETPFESLRPWLRIVLFPP